MGYRLFPLLIPFGWQFAVVPIIVPDDGPREWTAIRREQQATARRLRAEVASMRQQRTPTNAGGEAE